MNHATIRLTPAAPFDFMKSLSFLGEFKPAQGEQQITTGSLTKATRINGQTAVFSIRSTGTQLEMDVFSDQPVSTKLEERVRFFLSLDDDLKPFYALGRQDPCFAPVIDQLYGYHQVKFLTPFENAVWAILSAHNHMSIAHSMKQRLVQAFGSTMTVNGIEYAAFPEPEELKHADINSILNHQKRSDYILSAARAFSEVDEDWLKTGDYDQVEGWLRKIKGIGAWSASFIMIRAIGRMERLTAPESRLQAIVKRLYHTDDVERIASPYGVYQGYWAHYLRASGIQ